MTGSLYLISPSSDRSSRCLEGSDLQQEIFCWRFLPYSPALACILSPPKAAFHIICPFSWSYSLIFWSSPCLHLDWVSIRPKPGLVSRNPRRFWSGLTLWFQFLNIMMCTFDILFKSAVIFQFLDQKTLDLRVEIPNYLCLLTLELQPYIYEMLLMFLVQGLNL